MVESSKQKVGRPKKDRPLVNCLGVLDSLPDDNSDVYLAISSPVALKKVLTMFKAYSVDDISCTFKETSVVFASHDTQRNVDIAIEFDCHKAVGYFCRHSNYSIAIKLKTLTNILDKIGKEHIQMEWRIPPWIQHMPIKLNVKYRCKLDDEQVVTTNSCDLISIGQSVIFRTINVCSLSEHQKRERQLQQSAAAEPKKDPIAMFAGFEGVEVNSLFDHYLSLSMKTAEPPLPTCDCHDCSEGTQEDAGESSEKVSKRMNHGLKTIKQNISMPEKHSLSMDIAIENLKIVNESNRDTRSTNYTIDVSKASNKIILTYNQEYSSTSKHLIPEWQPYNPYYECNVHKLDNDMTVNVEIDKLKPFINTCSKASKTFRVNFTIANIDKIILSGEFSDSDVYPTGGLTTYVVFDLDLNK